MEKVKKPSKYELYYNSLTDEQKQNIKDYKESIQPQVVSKPNYLNTLIRTGEANLNRKSKRVAYRYLALDARKQAEIILKRYINVFPETSSEQKVNCYETIWTRYVYRFNMSLKGVRKNIKEQKNG